MNVEELIAKLQKCNPKATVITSSSNFEMNYADVEVSGANEYDSGKCESQRFRDAFDGGSYNAKTWSVFGGNEPVVSIT
jgi:hypothetical protein